MEEERRAGAILREICGVFLEVAAMMRVWLLDCVNSSAQRKAD